MLPTRYKQARTLVRRVCRLPGEQKSEFQRKIKRLRNHFERFNVDAADLCQWLMGIRPKDGSPAEVTAFWQFILNPSLEGVQNEESDRDRWRSAVFDDLIGIRELTELAGRPLPDNLRAAINHAKTRPGTPNTNQLFDRLRRLQMPHRLVLLKAAAEWIVARYQRGMENWHRQNEEWENEKRQWESLHPDLTPEVCDIFTEIFKNLVESPDGAGPKGIRRKNPRICSDERLREDKDNCVYAGEKGHGPLCWKYAAFLKTLKGGQKKHFCSNAKRYLQIRVQMEEKLTKRQLSREGKSPRDEAFRRLFRQKDMKPAENWFRQAWEQYLKDLGINEPTVMQHGCLPHCQKIGGTYEESQCQWNRHTHLCTQYKTALGTLDEVTLKLEPVYREWRNHFLARPRKPSFQYPSSRRLPMPKIFGAGFHEIDFDRSVLRLRLDDMPQGEWLEFGFIPWPKNYRPSQRDVQITSINISFVGSRARAAFRFNVSHVESPFGCAQDELDELRSRRYPRQAQDRQFLEAARKCLLQSFKCEEDKLRLLAIDLGEAGAQGAVYEGRKHERDVSLPIVKIDECYTHVPEVLKRDENSIPPPKFDEKKDWRGLRREHVGRHLAQLQTGATSVAPHRTQGGQQTATLRENDFRGLTRHIRWMIRDWARHNASCVIGAAEQHRCNLIVFESLRGFRPRGYDQMDAQQKARLAFFAFGQVRRKVVEKAVERGMRVVTVPYGFSSQVCSFCGHRQQDKGRFRKNKVIRQFKCECGDSKAKISETYDCNCRIEVDSDANAARVLARVFWGEIVLPERER